MLDNYTQGLRCQDVNSGLRTFDAASAVLTPVKKTRLIGMAADLAALIRDRELISDISALEAVAAAELDIPSTSFDTVVTVLEEAELVELTRVKGQVTGLTSSVPYYRDLYDTLGQAWRERRPSQLEEEMIAVIDTLAHSPVAAESLVTVTGIDDVDAVIRLGRDAELIKSVANVDGTILLPGFRHRPTSQRSGRRCLRIVPPLALSRCRRPAHPGSLWSAGISWFSRSLRFLHDGFLPCA